MLRAAAVQICPVDGDADATLAKAERSHANRFQKALDGLDA